MKLFSVLLICLIAASAYAEKEKYLMTFKEDCEEMAKVQLSSFENTNHKWLSNVKIMIAEFTEDEATLIQSENSMFSSCITQFEKDQIV